MNNSNWVVELLKKERIHQGLSINEVAKRGGFSKASVSWWERGKQSPTLVNLLTWMTVLNVSIQLNFDYEANEGEPDWPLN